MFPKPPGIPVFVMLPLDSVNAEGAFKYASSPWFAQSLHLLANSGAYGVAVDVWWGAVEREPGQYTWTGYKQLLEVIRPTGLKLQVVLSFHACGGNVGDTAHVPLPQWVLRCGENDPDLFFTDRPRGGSQGQRNREYLSVWADDAQGVLHGRSPMQCYEDFMASFRDNFLQDLGGMVEEVVVGAGPCGELRFPSYVEANGWRFPGVGEFQCYDRRALASLAAAARERGCPEWGFGGPHDTGDYNSNPEDTGFYNHEGSWDTPYGRFFLNWYSGSLMEHGDKLMAAAKRVFAHSLPLLKAGAGGQALQASRSSGAQQQGAGPSEAAPSAQHHQQRRQPQAGTTQAGAQAGSGGGAGAGGSAHGAAPLCVQGPGPGPMPGIAGSTGSAMHTSTASEGARSDGDGQSEAASSSGMSLPDQDVESDGHASSDRSSGMVQATSASAGGTTSNSPPGAPASLGTISQHSDCTDVVAGHAGPAGDAQAQACDAVDRTCSTVSMFNLLGDDTVSPDCTTPDNASAVATDEGGHQGEGQQGDEMRAGGSGRGEQGPGSAGAAGQAAAGRGGSQAGGGGAGPRRAAGAVHVPRTPARKELILTLKIAGIHWWFRSRSHAAELTAGYYNTATRDGYGAVVELCVKHQFSLTLTCVEMCDTQHPPPAQCGPEGLLKQVRSLCAARGVPLSGENALPIFLVDGVDSTALERIVYNTRVWHGAAAMSAYWLSRKQDRSSSPEPHLSIRSSEVNSDGGGGGVCSLQGHMPHSGRQSAPLPGLPVGYRRQPLHSGSGTLPPYTMYNMRPHSLPPVRSDPAIAATGLRGDSYADISEPLPPMRSFTFLRLAPQILQPSYQAPWMKFMWKMREGGFC